MWGHNTILGEKDHTKKILKIENNNNRTIAQNVFPKRIIEGMVKCATKFNYCSYWVMKIRNENAMELFLQYRGDEDLEAIAYNAWHNMHEAFCIKLKEKAQK